MGGGALSVFLADVEGAGGGPDVGQVGMLKKVGGEPRCRACKPCFILPPKGRRVPRQTGCLSSSTEVPVPLPGLALAREGRGRLSFLVGTFR